MPIDRLSVMRRLSTGTPLRFMGSGYECMGLALRKAAGRVAGAGRLPNQGQYF